MLRTLWAALVAVTFTFPLATATLVVAIFSSSSPLVDRIIRLWARAMVWGGGIDLRAENTERVDRAQRYILVANHYSYFDIPCIFVAIPQPIRFMAKVSLFKIPFFGWAIDRAGFIPIDRQNRRTAVKSFELAAERIRRGNTVVVFPEEGRSRERAMRPFQRGGFLLALRSGLPILPVAIDGTFDVFPARSLRVRPGVVTVKVGTPIATAGVSVRDKDRLAEEAREQIQRMLFGDAEKAGSGSA